MIQYLLSQWVEKYTRFGGVKQRGPISTLQMKTLNFDKVMHFVQGHIAVMNPKGRSCLLIPRPGLLFPDGDDLSTEGEF